MMESPSFWVGLSFFLFIALVYKPIARMAVKTLDARSARIEKELDDAVRLREEAQALLIASQRRQQQALKDAEEIMETARREAQSLTQDAQTKLEEALQKRIEMAMEKIRQSEAAVLTEVKNHAIDIAVNAARTIIKEQMGKQKAEELANLAMADIQGKLH